MTDVVAVAVCALFLSVYWSLVTNVAAPALAARLSRVRRADVSENSSASRLGRGAIHLILCVVLATAIAIEQQRQGVHDVWGAALLALLMGLVPFAWLLARAARRESMHEGLRTMLLLIGWISCSVLLFVIR